MSTTTATDYLSPYGAPAPLVRLFGWIMLAVLTAFLINNVLIVWYDFPTLGGLLNGGDPKAWVLAGVYALAIAVAVFWVFRRPDHALRYEARQHHRLQCLSDPGLLFRGAVLRRRRCDHRVSAGRGAVAACCFPRTLQGN